MPRILSVQIARPSEFTWRGRCVRTGIFKEPVAGPVAVGRLGLKGDLQADPTVHGGPRKAVYAYAAEHYDFWRRELPSRELPWGSFGENLVIEGLDESAVQPGDRFLAGNVVLEATTPRQACFKLGLKFVDMRMIRRFARSGRWGMYFAVAEPGELQAGDAVAMVSSV